MKYDAKILPSDFPCDNCAHDVGGCCDYPDTTDDYCVCGDKQVPVDATSDNTPAVFDYSVLENEDMEAALGYRERHTRRQQSYYLDEAKDLADIQSRLAKYDGGVFVKWLETETPYSSSAAYRLIDIHNQFSQLGKLEQEIFIALPKTLQYDISAKSAPPELTEQVMKGDITTHKDYIELKKQLDEANRKAELAELHEKNAHEGFKCVEKASKKNYVKYKEEHEKVRQLEDKIYKLEKEAENRTVEVAYDPDEVNRRVEEAVNRINTETERTLSAERKEFADTINEKDDKIWALEDKIKELEKTAPSQKKYIAVLTEEQVRKYGIKNFVEVK